MNPNETPDFLGRLETYRQGVQKIYDAYWKGHGYTHNPGSVAVIQPGKRYVRVGLCEMQWIDYADHSKGVLMSGGKPVLKKMQIHSFIDTTNGDVLKPASWKTPAKHARGNIFDESNGLARINHFGPEYLK